MEKTPSNNQANSENISTQKRFAEKKSIIQCYNFPIVTNSVPPPSESGNSVLNKSARAFVPKSSQINKNTKISKYENLKLIQEEKQEESTENQSIQKIGVGSEQDSKKYILNAKAPEFHSITKTQSASIQIDSNPKHQKDSSSINGNINVLQTESNYYMAGYNPMPVMIPTILPQNLNQMMQYNRVQEEYYAQQYPLNHREVYPQEEAIYSQGFANQNLILNSTLNQEIHKKFNYTLPESKHTIEFKTSILNKNAPAYYGNHKNTKNLETKNLEIKISNEDSSLRNNIINRTVKIENPGQISNYADSISSKQKDLLGKEMNLSYSQNKKEEEEYIMCKDHISNSKNNSNINYSYDKPEEKNSKNSEILEIVKIT